MRGKLGLAGLGVTLCAAVLALASCGQPIPFTQLAPLFRGAPPPPAPQSVYAMFVNTGVAVPPNSWTNSNRIELGATLAPGDSNQLAPEIEFVPAEQPFAGAANVHGQPGQAILPVPVMDASQQYHWQLRLRPPHGAPSAWVAFSGTIGYQPDPPAAPQFQALPRDGYVGTRQPTVSWKTDSDPAGTSGFAYSLDQSPASALPARLDMTASSVQLNLPQDG